MVGRLFILILLVCSSWAAKLSSLSPHASFSSNFDAAQYGAWADVSTALYGNIILLAGGEDGNAGGPDEAMSKAAFGQAQRILAIYVEPANKYGVIRPGVMLRGDWQSRSAYACRISNDGVTLSIDKLVWGTITTLSSTSAASYSDMVLVDFRISASGELACQLLSPFTGATIASISATDNTLTGGKIGMVGFCGAASACANVWGIYGFVGGDLADVPDFAPLNTRQWYVAPSGSDAWWAQSSYHEPLDQATVFHGEVNLFVRPGRTVWLKGGVYGTSNALEAQFLGDSANRISFKPVPGEYVEVSVDVMADDKTYALNLSGSRYVDLHNITFTKHRNRVQPVYQDNRTGFACLSCENVRFINIVNQGAGDPLGFAHNGDSGTLFYGFVVYDTGGDAPARVAGGPGYSQNLATSPEEVYRHILALPSWRGYHQIYGSQNQYAQKIAVEDSIYLDGLIYGGWSVGGTDTIGMRIENNWFNGCPNLPYRNNRAVSAIISNNTFWGSCIFGTANPSGFSSSTFSNNHCTGSTCQMTQCVTLADGVTPCSANTSSGNTTGALTQNAVKMLVNEFEPGWATIAIYNAEGRVTQSVDVSSVLRPGDRYALIDAYNVPLGPTQIGVVGPDGSITIRLDDSVPTAPIQDQTIPCWYYDRNTCLTDGTFVVAETVGQLPVGQYINQPALESSTWKVWAWNGSAWYDTGMTVETHQRPLSWSRVPGFFVYLLRSTPRTGKTTLIWSGSSGDTLEAGRLKSDGTLHANGIELTRSCSGGVCTAEVAVDGPRAWWRVNGGDLRVAEVM